MISLFVASIMAVSSVDVSVQTLDGNAVGGVLESISPEAILISTGDGIQRIDTRYVVSVEPVEPLPRPTTRPSVWVELVDGSILHCRSFEVAQRKAMLDLVSTGHIELDARAIATAQFRSYENHSDLQEQWETIRSSQRAGDTIVIVRKSSAGEDNQSAAKDVFALDSLDGVIHDVTADSLQFEFDGQKISLNRNKIAAVVYYHPLGRELPEPICRLVDVDGSQWFAKSLLLENRRVELVSTAGVGASLPLERVARFDFSSINTDFLDDLEPVLDTWQLRLGFGRRLASLKSSYQRFSDAHYDGDLKLYSESGFGRGAPGERVFQKGIALHSQTERQYLLARKYKQLTAIVGIDARYRQFGRVRLRITGDRKVLFEADISGTDEEPIELNLDVADVRRLTFFVDHGSGGGIGDRLNLCNARLSK